MKSVFLFFCFHQTMVTIADSKDYRLELRLSLQILESLKISLWPCQIVRLVHTSSNKNAILFELFSGHSSIGRPFNGRKRRQKEWNEQAKWMSDDEVFHQNERSVRTVSAGSLSVGFTQCSLANFWITSCDSHVNSSKQDCFRTESVCLSTKERTPFGREFGGQK